MDEPTRIFGLIKFLMLPQAAYISDLDSTRNLQASKVFHSLFTLVLYDCINLRHDSEILHHIICHVIQDI